MNRFQLKMVRFGQWAEQCAAQRPWSCAILVIPVIFVLLACIFHPAFETNDDPAIAMIASGKFFSVAPDEHLIFTHPVIGLALKSLYTHVPSMPWYGLYLLATQIVAHIVVAGLLLIYRPLRQALPWLAIWLGTIGIFFLTHLQFTTTAFLSGMAGMLLLWEAARRVCQRSLATTESPASTTIWPQTPRSIYGLLIAGSALLVWCEMIRWYMFYLMIVLPLPAFGVWWLMKWPGWQVTAKAVLVGTLVISGGLGMKALHMAYYQADPEWRDFYKYNELRAQFNDTVKVYYNDQTRDAFEQAGWEENDLKMIQSWCYEDPTVFSGEKLQQILDSRTWNIQQKSLKTKFRETLLLMQEKPMRIALFLLTALTLIVPVDRRHFLFNTVVVGTAFGSLLLLSILQKAPPARVYNPILVWSIVAITWNFLNRSLAVATTASRMPVRQAWEFFTERKNRPAAGFLVWGRAVSLVIATILVYVGMIVVLIDHYKYQNRCSVAQQELHEALVAFRPQKSKLYILWASSIKMEDINPLDSMTELADYRMLWFGWPQQLQSHRVMKSRYGLSNILHEWTEHPEVEAICPEICTEFFANFAKSHYAQDVRAERIGKLINTPIYRFHKASDEVASETSKLNQSR